jgi:hypothetical protein
VHWIYRKPFQLPFFPCILFLKRITFYNFEHLTTAFLDSPILTYFFFIEAFTIKEKGEKIYSTLNLKSGIQLFFTFKKGYSGIPTLPFVFIFREIDAYFFK